MTIESGGFSNKFHFDLSVRHSRSVEREFSNNGQQIDLTNRASNQGQYYSRSNAVNLLERTLSDGLGKKVDLETSRRDVSPARSIAKNVLSFVRQELREARNNGASEQELKGLLNQAREGIEQGFASAKDVLQGRFGSESRLENQIERAFNKIQHGLERLDNRFAPNIETSTEGNVQSGGPVQGGEVVANENSDIATQSNPPVTQAGQIEFTKTRQVQRSSSFELSIKTQEGDTVNLNIQQFLNKQVSKEATFNEDSFSVNIDRQVERGREISYQVNGDINEQEQAAIDSLIKKVDQLADKFYSNNFAGAFQKATRIGIDADQLANFSLNLQSSKTVEVTKTYREVQGIPASQQLPSPVESVGEFVGGIAEAVDDEAITDVVSNPVPVATELFKQIAIRDERYAQLVLEQSVEVIDDIAGLAEQQLAEAA